jgi:hypothetical protein
MATDAIKPGTFKAVQGKGDVGPIFAVQARRENRFIALLIPNLGTR